MVAMGLANEDGSSYLSRLCKLTPVQVDYTYLYTWRSLTNELLRHRTLYVNFSFIDWRYIHSIHS
jgi:hypothetical protein